MQGNRASSTPALRSPSRSRTGVIVGGIVGAVAGLLLLIVGVCCYSRHRRRTLEQTPTGPALPRHDVSRQTRIVPFIPGTLPATMSIGSDNEAGAVPLSVLSDASSLPSTSPSQQPLLPHKDWPEQPLPSPGLSSIPHTTATKSSINARKSPTGLSSQPGAPDAGEDGQDLRAIALKRDTLAVTGALALRGQEPESLSINSSAVGEEVG